MAVREIFTFGGMEGPGDTVVLPCYNILVLPVPSTAPFSMACFELSICRDLWKPQ
jgi:hypothetical protein